MHVGMIIWSICAGHGGMEQAGANLANHFAQSGCSVTIFHNNPAQPEQGAAFALAPEIGLVNLGLGAEAQEIEKARQSIISAGLDVIIVHFSWAEFLWIPCLLHNTGIPFIYAEHSDTEIIRSLRWNEAEYGACVSAADRVVVLQEVYKNSHAEYLRERIEVIPNCFVPPTKRACPGLAQKGRYRLLAVGRAIDDTKQFSLLICAFAVLARLFPDWDLQICGNGPDLERYRDLVKTLDLENRVDFPGYVQGSALEEIYAGAHLFCIPSRFEGLPLVLLEAQGYGLPVVGFAGCRGVADLVGHGQAGLLAAEMNTECLAESLAVLMGRAGLRENMGAAGLERSGQFHPEKVFPRWDALVNSLAGLKNKTRLNLDVPLTQESKDLLMLKTILQRKHPISSVFRG